MAQVKRRGRYRSPPPLRIPVLPNPIRFQAPEKTENNTFFETSSFSISSSINVEEQGKLSSASTRHRPSRAESISQKHLPLLAKFPFNMSFVRTPMETHVEDNVHKLRLRLIDSELKHQRRSTDEYIKRTQIQISSPIPMEIDLRPPSQLVHQQIVSNNSSRQTSQSNFSLTSPIGRDRIITDQDIERDLEIHQIQESLNNIPRMKQPLTISNYPYDPRLHLNPLNVFAEDPTYSSSNMDDLIDSMARRHLAYRRLDAAMEHQRRASGSQAPYIEPLASSRLTDYSYSRSRLGRDPTRVYSNSALNQMLRSRIDYYNRIQPDFDGMNMEETFRGNSYSKLPPISPGYDSHRLQQALNHNYDSPSIQRYPQSLPPAPLVNPTEHSIELPSDIFLASRAEAILSSNRTRRPVINKESDNESSTVQRQDVENGFFTDTMPTDSAHQRKDVRHLFPRAGIAVLFLMTLKRRAIKSKAHRKQTSPSAAIHKIRLQEIIVGLHRVYLEPDGPIYNVLIQTINHPVAFHDGFDRNSKNFSEAIDAIGESLKTVVAKIVDFMPKDGIVGTGKNSAVSILLQDGNPFPDNYFWQCERELLQFDGTKAVNINRQRAILLFIGIFIFRSLVTTLLLKPIKYRLILGQLTATQAANLKIFASMILHVGRRVAGANGKILPMPDEWQLSLFTDESLKSILDQPEIQSVLKTCENSLRQWCEEYIRRIDVNHGKEMRN